MTTREINIAQKLITENLLQQEDVKNCTKIHEQCKQLKTNISLDEIILQKHSNHFDLRQAYLECLIHTLETPELAKFIDSISLEIGKNWEKIFDEQEGNEKLHKDLIAHEIDYPISYTSLLRKNKDIEKNLSPLKIRNNNATNWEVSLSFFLNSIKNNQLLPLNTKLTKLIGKNIHFSIIEGAETLQKKLEKKWNIKIPLIHILIKKYKIEPYLLHAIIISQMRREKAQVEVWISGVYIASFPHSKNFISELNFAQEKLKTFFETSFKMTWLKFRPEKEVLILEELQRHVPHDMWKKTIKIREQLSRNGFTLPLLKLLVINDAISESLVFVEVLEKIYNVARIEAEKYAKNFYKEKAVEKNADRIKIPINESKANQALSFEETMSMPASMIRKKQKASLKKTISISKTEKKKENFSEKKIPEKKQQTTSNQQKQVQTQGENIDFSSTMKIPMIQKKQSADESKTDKIKFEQLFENKPISAAERMRQNLLKNKEAALFLNLAKKGHILEHNFKTIEAKMTPDVLRVRIALKKEFVNEKQIIQVIILQNDSGTNYFNFTMWDILHKENIITLKQYDEIKDIIQEAKEVEIPILSKNMDLKIASALIENNLTSREKVQKALRIQRILQHVFIPKSLNEVLVETRIISSDVVEPILKKIKQDLRKASKSAGEISLSTEAIKSKNKKSAPYNLGMVILLICLCAFTIYNISNSLYKIEEQKNKDKIIVKKEKVISRKKKTKKEIKNTDIVKKIKPKKNIDHEHSKVKIRNGISIEKEKLAKFLKNRKQKSNFPISLKNGTKVIYLKRSTSYGIVVSGKLNIDPIPGPYRVMLKIELFNTTKEVSYYNARCETQQGEFQTVIGPFSKELASNVYFIKVAIIPSMQKRAVSKYYTLTKTLKWWIPFTHSNSKSKNKKKTILKAIKEQKNAIKKIVQKLQKQQIEINTLLRKKTKIIRNNYSSWRNDWQKKQDAITLELHKTTGEYFIPVYTKTEKQLHVLLKHLNNTVDILEKWTRALDLFPPQANSHKWELEWSKYQLYLKQERILIKNIIEKL